MKYGDYSGKIQKSVYLHCKVILHINICTLFICSFWRIPMIEPFLSFSVVQLTVNELKKFIASRQEEKLNRYGFIRPEHQHR